MRKYLISAAILALFAAPSAWAQPPADRGNHGEGQHDWGGREHGSRGGGPASPAAPPAAAAAANGGGENRSFGRDHGPAPQAANQAPQNLQPQPNRGGENRNFGRGERGFDRGARDRGPAAQMADQAPQNRGDENRGDRRFDDRGFNRRGGEERTFNDYRGGERRFDRRGPDDRAFNDNRGFDRRDYRNAFNDNRGGDFNREGRTNYRAPGYGGQRHNFTGFRDYHRDFRAAHRFQVPSYRRPAGWYSHRWSYGEFLPAAFWARDYWLIDFADYDLPPPPYGAVWVRVDRDALLIDEDSGEIITVAYDVFY